MNDVIHIHGLRVDALVGAYRHERDGTQPLLFDVLIEFDNRTPAASDDLADTVDYAQVCQWIRDAVAASQPVLLETLIEQVADGLLDVPHVRGVRVTIHKPEAAKALGCDSVGVTIERSRA